MTVSVVENAATWGNFQPMLEKAKKTCPEKNSDIFSKKSHPKQISYTFLIFFLYSIDHPGADITKNVQLVSISCIVEKVFPSSSSVRRFLYRSRPY